MVNRVTRQHKLVTLKSRSKTIGQRWNRVPGAHQIATHPISPSACTLIILRCCVPGIHLWNIHLRGTYRLRRWLFRIGMHRMTGHVAASRRALIVVRGAIASVSITISTMAPVAASSARSNAAAKSSVRVTRSP